MLNKNEIIDELKNDEFIVRNAIYEHICNLHLYDDEDINKALILFLKNNYNLGINYAGLICSKLNKEIIECLIQIYSNEKDDSIKVKIEDVLVNHFELIKDLDYKFENIFQDEYNLLLYKKIKHFINKNTDELLELYKKNIEQYYLEDEETYTSDILRRGIETALIQTEQGKITFIVYVLYLMGMKNLNNNFLEETISDNNIMEFRNIHLPYLIHPLCKISNYSYANIILLFYFTDIDFLENADECNHYFSNICNKEFVANYMEILKKIEKKEIPDYYYDIAEYLNSKEIDDFLLEKMNTCKDKEIILNIIRILASKFDNRIIEITLDKIKNDDFNNEDGYLELELALAPLLIIEKRNDKVSKSIIEEAKKFWDIEEIVEFEDEYDYDYESNEENYIDKLYQIQNNLRDFVLKDKSHIKKYKKARKIHGEIMDSMMRYFENSKYQENIEKHYFEIIKQKGNNINISDTFFDTRTQLGAQALANVVIYKNIENMECITEEFLKDNRYKKEEKKEFLKSMLDSKAGLYEIIKTDFEEAQVYAKNVLNGEIICITDIGMSGNKDNTGHYFYTRIISYDDINFGTGLSIIFDKKDKFIQKWIKDNKKDYSKKQEIIRFLELYNKYRDDENKILVRMNKF
jgi:hypothetical protein